MQIAYAVEFTSLKRDIGQPKSERYADIAEALSASAIMKAQGHDDARMTVTLGSTKVIINRMGGSYFSVLTCNNGETALRSEHHDTIKGADRWANRVLKRHQGV